MITLNEYMNNNKSESHEWLTKRVVMNDGFNISIQAGEFNYSSPRRLTDARNYSSFELGFPSELDVLIENLAEEKGTVDTVFPYVDRSVVEKLITKHGGIKGFFVKDEE